MTDKADDYGGFKEVIYRRYQRVLFEDLEKPDLIIVDGGKGQVNAAKAVLDELSLDIPIAGLKKNNLHKLESIIYEDKEYLLDTVDDLSLYLNEISEEVHRFAVTFHQQTRTKNAFLSPLDEIKE